MRARGVVRGAWVPTSPAKCWARSGNRHGEGTGSSCPSGVCADCRWCTHQTNELRSEQHHARLVPVIHFFFLPIPRGLSAAFYGPIPPFAYKSLTPPSYTGWHPTLLLTLLTSSSLIIHPLCGRAPNIPATSNPYGSPPTVKLPPPKAPDSSEWRQGKKKETSDPTKADTLLLPPPHVTLLPCTVIRWKPGSYLTRSPFACSHVGRMARGGHHSKPLWTAFPPLTHHHQHSPPSPLTTRPFSSPPIALNPP